MPWDAPGRKYDQASCEEGGRTQKDENTAQNFLRAGQAITQSAAAGEEDKLTLPLALLASPCFSQAEIFLRSQSVTQGSDNSYLDHWSIPSAKRECQSRLSVPESWWGFCLPLSALDALHCPAGHLNFFLHPSFHGGQCSCDSFNPRDLALLLTAEAGSFSQVAG